MQIFVRSYAGESLPVEVSATSTVLELKQHLEARLGTSLLIFREIFAYFQPVSLFPALRGTLGAAEAHH